jgi:hypothetical protein
MAAPETEGRVASIRMLPVHEMVKGSLQTAARQPPGLGKRAQDLQMTEVDRHSYDNDNPPAVTHIRSTGSPTAYAWQLLLLQVTVHLQCCQNGIMRAVSASGPAAVFLHSTSWQYIDATR